MDAKKNMATWFVKLEVHDVIVRFESSEGGFQQCQHPLAVFGLEAFLDIGLHIDRTPRTRGLPGQIKHLRLGSRTGKTRG